MDQLVAAVVAHPVILSWIGLAVAGAVALVMRRQHAAGVFLVPGLLASACMGLGVGAFGAARAVTNGFAGIERTGSGGIGTVAAILTEARDSVLLATAGTVLVLMVAVGLSWSERFLVSSERVGPTGEQTARAARVISWLVPALAFLGIGVGAHDLAMATFPLWVIGPDAPPLLGTFANRIAINLVALMVEGLACSGVGVVVLVGSFLVPMPRRAPPGMVKAMRVVLVALLLVATVGLLLGLADRALLWETAVTGAYPRGRL